MPVEHGFDVVYDFAIAQLSHHLLDYIDVTGARQTPLLLLAVWSAWRLPMVAPRTTVSVG